MSVKTTLNIHKAVMEKIDSASVEMGKTRSEIIILLLMEVMSDKTLKPAARGPVKYQDRDAAVMWHKFHFSLREDEYEYFIDLRNFLKCSLSRLVAESVKKYLNVILYGEKSDKKPFHNYIISKEDANGVICWKIFWGIPKDVEKFIQLS